MPVNSIKNRMIVIVLLIISFVFTQDTRYLDEIFDDVEKIEDVFYGNAPDLPFIFLYEWNTDDRDLDKLFKSYCKRILDTPFNVLPSKSFLRTRLLSPPKLYSLLRFNSYI